MPPRHEAYIQEARRLQEKYADKIHILIGFEAEWCREEYAGYVLSLADHPQIDYFIGSIHHVNSVAIDFDIHFYAKALASVGDNATEEALYERFYDQQHEMLTALRPRVVGHFDLIRLLSADPERDVREWKGVWRKIVRNLEFVKGYGGWLECNSSALRKSLAEPYPCRSIAEVRCPRVCISCVSFIMTERANA
jgi:histidinol-phosphatase (PHP family)